MTADSKRIMKIQQNVLVFALSECESGIQILAPVNLTHNGSSLIGRGLLDGGPSGPGDPKPQPNMSFPRLGEN